MSNKTMSRPFRAGPATRLLSKICLFLGCDHGSAGDLGEEIGIAYSLYQVPVPSSLQFIDKKSVSCRQKKLFHIILSVITCLGHNYVTPLLEILAYRYRLVQEFHVVYFVGQYVLSSVVDPSTLNLDLDPGLCFHF